MRRMSMATNRPKRDSDLLIGLCVSAQHRPIHASDDDEYHSSQLYDSPYDPTRPPMHCRSAADPGPPARATHCATLSPLRALSRTASYLLSRTSLDVDLCLTLVTALTRTHTHPHTHTRTCLFSAARQIHRHGDVIPGCTPRAPTRRAGCDRPAKRSECVWHCWRWQDLGAGPAGSVCDLLVRARSPICL